MSYIKTFGRVRPSAKGTTTSALVSTDKTVKVETENGQKTYELHRIFKHDSTQEEVFQCVSKKIVEDSVDGFNGTVFAYGQTGSGKTHTMLGPCNSWSDPDQKGLIPRSIEYLFELLDAKARDCQKFTFSVDVEFVELYNEDIFDLLNAKNKVQLRDLGERIQLDGAKVETVDNSLDLMHVVQRAWQARSVGVTAMNNESSRSHALLIIKIKTKEVTGEFVKDRFATLNLVDLAGSERQSHTKATGDRLKEATNINSSLTVLGRCIRILSKPSGVSTYVPYRDSHLTHILKNSLGGNSKTAVIVNMHPDKEFLAESSSTLLFAQSCTLIKNAVHRNEVMTGDQENSYKKAIQELRRQVDEAPAKAREEYAKKLKVSEEAQHRLILENDSLKKDNSELRGNYNLALLKYLSNNCTAEVIDELKVLLSSANHNQSIVEPGTQDLLAKNTTLKLEREASEKRCQQLQRELEELRSKYCDSLDTTLLLQTPNAKGRRSSSRPKRRETQYMPSPSRMAMLNEEEDEETAEIIKAKLECNVLSLRNELENEKERAYTAQKKYDDIKCDLNRKETEYERVIVEKDEEISELENKVRNNGETLERLLQTMSEVERAKAQLESTIKVNQDKHEAEMEAMRNDYKSQVIDLEAQLSESKNDSQRLAITKEEINAKLQEELDSSTRSYNNLENKLQILSDENTSLKRELAEKSELAATVEEISSEKSKEAVSLQKELDNKMKEILRIKKDAEEKDKTVKDLQKDIAVNAKATVLLQADIDAKTQQISGIQQDLGEVAKKNAALLVELTTKSTLISSLEQEVAKKAKAVSELEKQLDQNVDALADCKTIKRRYEESLENEKHSKKAYEDLKNSMNDIFLNHQKDVKLVKAKKDQEIESIQRSLDCTSKLLKDQEKNYKKEKSELQQKFDQKVGEMDKRFKEMHMESLKTQEEKIKRESMNVMESTMLVKENKIRELEERCNYFEKQHEEDTEAINSKLGLKSQKMSYVDKIRREKADMESTISQLRSEVARLSKQNREPPRVLRSRNIQQ
ncbi:hypothetical protein GCK72_014837 [Caenorhabditis remanei]|uniref:Kinesin motor domain-containing protein n=1 Tax=Caenorhabditis remanei TaxID=31234 RepID=A0A6A5GV15_CAERE|nr:hypothetical protein GCK72_014837 [Caenorhabditis remanei]KAF1758379.1 hypothetical protein GCK72_014837 [Caenorhabditis remanei]